MDETPEPNDSTRTRNFPSVPWKRVAVWAGRFSSSALRRLLRALGYGLAGGTIVFVALAVAILNDKPDLEPWQEIELEEEFTRESDVSTFAEYLRLEDRLFDELETTIYRDGGEKAEALSRYHHGSLADPAASEPNWNRTFEWRPESGSATCAVLLLHGMSDSPYSLLSVGRALRNRGAHVIGLRLPGHGTAPSGMLSFDWQDMAAAVELAARHLEAETGGAPLYVFGYSNGGALAVHYACQSLQGDLPRPDGVVLLSPAIGVTPLAAFAVWQQRLGSLLGLEKLEWSGVNSEYDPYKYVSFSVNAGDQVYRLTREIGRSLDRLGKKGRLGEFPPVLAFQSVVDATVSTPALIEGLFARLPEGGHELVLFDLNRTQGIGPLLQNDPAEHLRTVVQETRRSYDITVLSNRDSGDLEVESFHYPVGQSEAERSETGLVWPRGLYSLAHVSLPFPPDDPLYGNFPIEDAEDKRLRLGMVALRGERGVLEIPPADQLRLRWNPFHTWMEGRFVDFVFPAASVAKAQ